MSFDDRSDGFEEVQGEAVPIAFVGVDYAEAWVETECDCGEAAFGGGEGVAVVEQGVDRLGGAAVIGARPPSMTDRLEAGEESALIHSYAASSAERVGRDANFEDDVRAAPSLIEGYAILGETAKATALGNAGRRRPDQSHRGRARFREWASSQPLRTHPSSAACGDPASALPPALQCTLGGPRATQSVHSVPLGTYGHVLWVVPRFALALALALATSSRDVPPRGVTDGHGARLRRGRV